MSARMQYDAIKISVRVGVIWMIGVGVSASKIADTWFASWCLLLYGGFRSFLHGCLFKFAWVSSQDSSWFPWTTQEQQGRYQSIFIKAFKTAHCYFYIILLGSQITRYIARGDYISAWIPGGKDHWGTFWRLTTIIKLVFFFYSFNKDFYLNYFYQAIFQYLLRWSWLFLICEIASLFWLIFDNQSIIYFLISKIIMMSFARLSLLIFSFELHLRKLANDFPNSVFCCFGINDMLALLNELESGASSTILCKCLWSVFGITFWMLAGTYEQNHLCQFFLL